MSNRWQRRARTELGGVDDLVRVLFKPRNDEPWTREDRSFLRRELATLARRWAPGFLLFLLPGGLLLAPTLAWYLDRRRRGVVRVGGHRANDPTPAQALAAAAAAAPR